MGKGQHISVYLQYLTYYKTADEIKEACSKKVKFLKTKIEERQARIASLRKEYDIDDAALISLLTDARRNQQNSDRMSFTYMANSSTHEVSASASNKKEERSIGAGVVNNLLTENDFIQTEKEAAQRLELIQRNLFPVPTYSENGTRLPDQGFQVTEADLEYFGF